MTSLAIAPTKSATTFFSEDGLTLSNDHTAIFLVLICAWKRYVVDVCFYMNDIHVKKCITELVYEKNVVADFVGAIANDVMETQKSIIAVCRYGVN
jgi:hypothetical protein